VPVEVVYRAQGISAGAHPFVLAYRKHIWNADFDLTMAEEGNPGPLLCDAARRGNINLIKKVKEEFGTNFSKYTTHHDGLGNTPLHYAASQGHMDVLKLLLDNNADINSQNGAGDTPLNCAVIADQTEVVSYLLLKNANREIRNKKKQMAKHLIKSEKVRKLLKEQKKEEDLDLDMLAEADDVDE